jgi:phosphatidylglycerol lysyltransferase
VTRKWTQNLGPLGAKLLHYIGPLFGLAIFVVAIWALRFTLKNATMPEYPHLGPWKTIVMQFRAIPIHKLLLSLGIAAANYLLLTGYDTLAFRYIGRPLAYRRIMLGSFLGYVFSHNMGLSVFGASAARLRVYSTWGVTAVETVKIVFFCGLTFWIGFLTLGGVVLLLEPAALTRALHLPEQLGWLFGILFLALVVGYVLLCWKRRRPLKLRDWELPLPTVRMAGIQIGLSCVDWVLAGSVLYMLLPADSGLSFGTFGAYFLGMESAVLGSHVPGGVGVLEIVFVKLFCPPFQNAQAMGIVLAYRVIYYLIPLLVAVGLLAMHEIVQTRRAITAPATALTRWVSANIPQVLAVGALAVGAITLFSTALPSEPQNLRFLRQHIGLYGMETFHFMGGVIGISLLLMARALQRRLAWGYYTNAILIFLGIIACIGKGLDWEETVPMAIILLALLPSRRFFFRQTPMLSERFSFAWTTVVAAILGVWVILGLFVHPHLEDYDKLTQAVWSFDIHDRPQAARFLRSTVGGAFILLWFAGARLMRRTTPEPALPGARELARAQGVIGADEGAWANLALGGDKRLLFGPGEGAFLMYAKRGRSLIALGEPVGARAQWPELAWEFHEMADRGYGWAAFFDVSNESQTLYSDLGLDLIRIGQEGRVPLFGSDFLDADGAACAARARCAFELVPAGAAGPILAELASVADAWLANAGGVEKGFVAGRFCEEYLRQFPLAVARQAGKIVGFGVVMLGGTGVELGLDFMRQGPGREGVLEFLLEEAMRWGQGQGYRWFNLGLTPVAGPEDGDAAMFTRIGPSMYRHGEHFGDLAAARRFKDAFGPVWADRYLAAPGGLAMARIAHDLSAMIEAR